MVYIGGTCQTLRRRMAEHRGNMNSMLKQQYNLYVAMREHGKEQFYIELLEDYASERKEQLLKRMIGDRRGMQGIGDGTRAPKYSVGKFSNGVLYVPDELIKGVTNNNKLSIKDDQTKVSNNYNKYKSNGGKGKKGKGKGKKGKGKKNKKRY